MLEDAIDAWPATDTELRVRTIKWRSGFRAGPDDMDGEQALGIDGLFTWLVRGHCGAARCSQVVMGVKVTGSDSPALLTYRAGTHRDVGAPSHAPTTATNASG